MTERSNKGLAIFSISLILMAAVFLSPSEDSEISRSHNYPFSEIDIFSEGEIIEFHPNSVELHNNWTVSPELPQGLRMFKDSFQISDEAIDSHGNRTCSITHIGGVMCWSDFSQYNDLAEVLFNEEGGDFVVTEISVGGKHDCALINYSVSTEINCWGSDANGQMGDGWEREDNHSPTSISSVEGSWTDLSSGDSHSCGVLSRSEIYCWGGGEFGQIGDGSRADRYIPARVVIEGNSQFVSIKSGDFHNCALTSEGEVWCWGWNGYGQIGNGGFENAIVPSRVNLGDGQIAKKIYTGPVHSCAITETNEGYCWGGNYESQISDIDDDSIEEPLEIFPGITSAVGGILTGDSISCMTNSNGELGCIGSMSPNWKGSIEETGEIRHFAPGSGGFCILNSSGQIQCTDDSGSEKLVTEEGGVFLMIVPSILYAGSITGIALNDGYSRHNITSNFEGENITSSVSILIDFEMDVDSDGWLNMEELLCDSEQDNIFSTPVDTDLDGQCDAMDEDDDGDGVLDFKDKFPLDDSEWADDDGDGIGKNTDGFEISEPVLGIFVTISILLCILILEVKIGSSRKK